MILSRALLLTCMTSRSTFIEQPEPSLLPCCLSTPATSRSYGLESGLLVTRNGISSKCSHPALGMSTAYPVAPASAVWEAYLSARARSLSKLFLLLSSGSSSIMKGGDMGFDYIAQRSQGSERREVAAPSPTTIFCLHIQ